MGQAIAPTGIRMPDEIKDWLTKRAASNERSMNKEVLFILRKEMERDAQDERE
ncbi:Arc family DNA-binding protein [Aeromonas dhakensis]|uniref:Arc family DNA-binding protein n=1 Tax=Aeromonas dhakensis TaxID=196024 RepID=UPI003BA0CFD7